MSFWCGGGQSQPRLGQADRQESQEQTDHMYVTMTANVSTIQAEQMWLSQLSEVRGALRPG